jgi:hypothetical protein
MRVTILAIAAAACIGAAIPATAQSIDVGPGGVGVDLRSPRQRERDWDREEARRDRARERRRWDETGSTRGDCREVTIRERNDYGEMVTRTRRDCR